MLVVLEEPLRQRQRHDHQLVVVIDLVDRKRAGNEGMLVQQRQVRSHEVDTLRPPRRIEMECPSEMGIDTYLRRQTPS